ncbi:MAG: hypothetical protein M3N97_15690 [Pseudomonadota bacterium]|nr:hypothetical protein [Pseudomonadota bacterium]
MKVRRLMSAPVLTLAAWALCGGTARADTVLYDGTSLVQGEQAFVQSFTLSTAGTLSITVTSISWLDNVAGLTAFVTTATSASGSTTSGSESVSVNAGTVYAHWFGDAKGTYDLGLVSVKITFQPSSVTAVPLPPSLGLMVGGLGVLFGWQRRQRAIIRAWA